MTEPADHALIATYDERMRQAAVASGFALWPLRCLTRSTLRRTTRKCSWHRYSPTARNSRGSSRRHKGKKRSRSKRERERAGTPRHPSRRYRWKSSRCTTLRPHQSCQRQSFPSKPEIPRWSPRIHSDRLPRRGTRQSNQPNHRVPLGQPSRKDRHLHEQARTLTRGDAPRTHET